MYGLQVCCRRPQAGVLRMREALDVRDSLCLQLVLGNAKRGGDITHIRAEDLDRVEIQEGYGELVVSIKC
jgi:hypothetical protein